MRPSGQDFTKPHQVFPNYLKTWEPITVDGAGDDQLPASGCAGAQRQDLPEPGRRHRSRPREQLRYRHPALQPRHCRHRSAAGPGRLKSSGRQQRPGRGYAGWFRDQLRPRSVPAVGPAAHRPRSAGAGAGAGRHRDVTTNGTGPQRRRHWTLFSREPYSWNGQPARSRRLLPAAPPP